MFTIEQDCNPTFARWQTFKNTRPDYNLAFALLEKEKLTKVELCGVLADE
jgi:hypothetical protein